MFFSILRAKKYRHNPVHMHERRGYVKWVWESVSFTAEGGRGMHAEVRRGILNNIRRNQSRRKQFRVNSTALCVIFSAFLALKSIGTIHRRDEQSEIKSRRISSLANPYSTFFNLCLNLNSHFFSSYVFSLTRKTVPSG